MGRRGRKKKEVQMPERIIDKFVELDDYESSNTDLLALYFRDIAKIPLLTPEEEKTLFRRLKELKQQITKIMLEKKEVYDKIIELAHKDFEEVFYLPIEYWRSRKNKTEIRKIIKEELEKNKIPDYEINWDIIENFYKEHKYEELKDLFNEYYEIRNKIITANLRFVVSIALKFMKYFELADLISFGTIGLMEAIKRYDVDKNNKFSTYCYHWIKEAILRNFKKNIRLVRVDERWFRMLKDIQDKERELANILGKIPTYEELADYTGIPADRIKEIYDIVKFNLSLDYPINEDKDTSLFEIVKSEEDAYRNVKEEMLIEDIQDALNILTKRERYIMIARYFQGKQLKDIARELNISEQRVAQIEARALAKLRYNPKVRNKLIKYFRDL